jgi:WD40 repeat protein
VSADGKRAVFSTARWEVGVWKDGKVASVPDGIDFAHVAISPDGRWAVGGGHAVLTRVWDLDAMVVAADLPGEGAWVHVAFSGDGRKMAAGDARGLRVYEVPGFRLLWESRHREPGGFAVRPAFSADSRMVAATMEMRQPWLLDAGTGEALARLDHPFAEGITQLCFSPDSRRLAVLGTRSSVFLWDLAGLRGELETLGMAW